MKYEHSVTKGFRACRLAGLLVVASCKSDDVTRSTDAPGAKQLAQASVTEPQRDTVGWAALSDSTLWATIVRTDTVVVVGLKEPGSQRGVVRGRSVVSRARWKSAIQALGADTRNRIVSRDTVRLPVVRIKPADVAALAAFRRLAFVDYVEPNFVPVISADGSSGCSSSGSSGGSGDSPFGGQLIPTYPSGDYASATYFTSNTYFGSNWLYSGSDGMNVANAWKLSTGSGVMIGITDTGLDISPSSEFSNTYFASGQSAGRSLEVIQSSAPTCSHGTRIAGLAAAPMNGRLVSGVAYNSNIVSVRHSDGVVPGELPAGSAILDAGISGAKVIAMAWGLTSPSFFVNDVIDHLHYNLDVMFVGAAGTCIGGWCPGNDNTAIFPASKEEVLAVTSANHDGSRPNVYNFGNKAGVVAYTSLATVGLIPGIVTIGGSSGATGFVAGAAALVRARNPGYSARQSMDAIMWSSGIRCGAPLAWRDAMINVSAAVGGACVSHMFGDITYYVHPWNVPSYTPVDYWVRTLRSSAQFVPGGSGSYSPQWVAKPEQEIVTSVDGNVTDSFGNLFWQSRRSIRFLPAWDGAPYLTEVQASILDGPLGTVDRRSMQVLVCQAPNNCYQTTRAWPTPPPPPPPLTVAISGPTTVAVGYAYTWTAVISGGYGNVAYSWTAGSQNGISSSISASFCASGTVNVTATDGHSTVSATHPVNASENEPPPPGGQYVPC